MADYDAFISYSHAADGGLAPALKGALERLGKPWRRRRALRVFQDASGLGASPGLWSDIQHALDSTRYFVLLASPPAAQSQWVQQEVAYFLSRHPPERCLIAITAGDWSWDGAARDFDWSRSDALPHELHGAFSEEPLVVDLRWARDDRQLELADARFRAAAAELAAPIHGLSPDDLDSEGSARVPEGSPDPSARHRRPRQSARGGVRCRTSGVGERARRRGRNSDRRRRTRPRPRATPMRPRATRRNRTLSDSRRSASATTRSAPISPCSWPSTASSARRPKKGRSRSPAP